MIPVLPVFADLSEAGVGTVSQPLDTETPYAGLTPDQVLAAVEGLGLVADGRLLALNSYENRVYRVGLEEQDAAGAAHVVAKFYRAGRWSDEQIREEHAFIAELAAADLAVARPMLFGGESLHRHAGYRFTLFEHRPGAAPDLDLPGHRELLGRTLGRLHAAGSRQTFRYRPRVADWRHGARARSLVLASGMVPSPVDQKYDEVATLLVGAVSACFSTIGPLRQVRLHGDCHPGNILWQASGPLFVDFDDCLTGPAVQDLWMYAAGDPAQMQKEWTELLHGYEQFAHFDNVEAGLVEALRAVRMLNHAAWIAQRWHDPAFPLAFPWFGGPRYWERHVDELREQLEAVEDPPLMRA